VFELIPALASIQPLCSKIKHSLYAVQLVKDAIAINFAHNLVETRLQDQQNRTSTSTSHQGHYATLALDSAHMHKRGFALALHALAETHAAAIVNLSKWTAGTR
jgi:23S rRNA G2445 N2-methylase RlmL